MAKHLNLAGWGVQCHKGKTPKVDQFGLPAMNGGQSEMADVWALVFTESGTGDTITYAFTNPEIKDALVGQLTGGIEIAGPGDLRGM